MKYYMHRLQKDKIKVQVFVTPEFTPTGTITRVCNEYILLDQQDGLLVNNGIMIPVKQIKYVRELE